MSFNVSSLSDFTKKATEFLLEGIVYSDSYAKYDIQSGIQYKQYLNYLDSDPQLIAGGCDLTATGTTTFDEKEITVVPFAIKEKFCLNDLRKKDIVGEVGTGKGNMTNDLRVPLTKDLIAKLKQKLDKQVFQGKTSSGDLINGWLTEMSGDADVVDTSTSYTAVTVDNIAAIIQEMVLTVPEDMWSRGKMTIHAPLAYYNLYRTAMINANLYHMDPTNPNPTAMPVFGWEGMVELVAESGMNGATQMFLTWDKNLVVGVDELTEVSSAKFVYQEVENNVYFIGQWKLGVTYKFGSEIVLFTKA